MHPLGLPYHRIVGPKKDLALQGTVDVSYQSFRKIPGFPTRNIKKYIFVPQCNRDRYFIPGPPEVRENYFQIRKIIRNIVKILWFAVFYVAVPQSCGSRMEHNWYFELLAKFAQQIDSWVIRVHLIHAAVNLQSLEFQVLQRMSKLSKRNFTRVRVHASKGDQPILKIPQHLAQQIVGDCVIPESWISCILCALSEYNGFFYARLIHFFNKILYRQGQVGLFYSEKVAGIQHGGIPGNEFLRPGMDVNIYRQQSITIHVHPWTKEFVSRNPPVLD